MIVTIRDGSKIPAHLVPFAEAYSMGRKAAWAGKALDCNPWPGHYEQRFHWQEGWESMRSSMRKESVVSRRKI